MVAELFTALTFVLVFAIVLGGYWAVVVRTEDTELTRLRSRMAAAAGRISPIRSSLLKETTPLSEIAGLNALLARAASMIAPIKRLVERSRVQTTVGTVILGSATLAAVAMVATYWYTRALPLAAIMGAVAGAGPFVALRVARQRVMRKIEEQLPEAMDLIARSLRAGHAFSSGLKVAGEEIPDPLGAEFRALHDRHSFGQPLPQALREFADRVELIDARFFVTAVLTQREAGGNLAEVLDHLAWVVRDRFRLKREVRSKSAHGRISGLVIAALPPVLFIHMWFTDPERVSNFIGDPLGTRMVVAALVAQGVGTLLIRKIINIRY